MVECFEFTASFVFAPGGTSIGIVVENEPPFALAENIAGFLPDVALHFAYENGGYEVGIDFGFAEAEVHGGEGNVFAIEFADEFGAGGGLGAVSGSKDLFPGGFGTGGDGVPECVVAGGSGLLEAGNGRL